MTLSPLTQCLLIVAERGREILAREQAMAAANDMPASEPAGGPVPKEERAAPRRKRKVATAEG
jgi:hypothetical protein